MYNTYMKLINLNDRLRTTYEKEKADMSAKRNMWFSIWTAITSVLFIVLVIGGGAVFALVGFNLSLATPTTLWAEAKRGIIIGSIILLTWLLLSLIGFKVFKLWKKRGLYENNETIA